MTLSRRILLLSLGAATAVLVLFMIPLALLLHSAASDQVRQGATDTARSVADYLSSQPSAAALEAYVVRANARDDAYQVTILRAGGEQVGDTLPGLGSVERDGDGDDFGGPAHRDGDSDSDDDSAFTATSPASVLPVDGGRLVVIEVRQDPRTGDDEVVVFAPSSRVWKQSGEQLLALAAAAVVILFLAAVAAQRITRRLVANLAETARVADSLGQGNLIERVPEDGPPEVLRVAQALNRLAGRIDELLAAERELVADLSHRLRTPLMALRLDVESLSRSGESPELAGDLVAHVDHVERTLTAVIHAARRNEREGVRPSCDVSSVVVDSVGFWRPLAEDQGRVFELVTDHEPSEARCSAGDLRAAVDALLENCLAHTPEGTPIRVTVLQAPAGALVEVADRGPGFDTAALTRGRSDRGSTGLGLDIARSCAEASGGTLDSFQEDGWAVVRLVLGSGWAGGGNGPRRAG